MFLVDGSWQPAPGALDVLAAITDTHFTTEVGAFNLELNLDPQEFRGDCLSLLQAQLEELLAIGRRARTPPGWRWCWPGSCPPSARATCGWRTWSRTPVPGAEPGAHGPAGRGLRAPHQGTDELRVRQDSVMAEACNASFQVHLQVSQDEFANLYNVAQLLAGPVLACATNSPLLFGKRLWAETHRALRAVRGRAEARPAPAGAQPRVTFGSGWVQQSVAELYREDISRHRPVLAPDDYDDRSRRWPKAGCRTSRHCACTPAPCGAGTGPATASPGACRTSGSRTGSCPRAPRSPTRWATPRRPPRRGTSTTTSRLLEFEHARANLVAAARQGLGAQLTWLDGEERNATTLALDHLLPLAAEGWTRSASAPTTVTGTWRSWRGGCDRDTGSRWLLSSLSGLRAQGTEGQRLNSVTAAMVAGRRAGARGGLDAGQHRRRRLAPNFVTIEQLMTTDLVTVNADDPVELRPTLMDWHRIRQVLVEDSVTSWSASCRTGPSCGSLLGDLRARASARSSSATSCGGIPSACPRTWRRCGPWRSCGPSASAPCRSCRTAISSA